MSNNLNYNINFGVQNENRVIAAVSNVTAGLVNVEKGVFKMDNVFNKTVNSIQKKINTIQFSSILDQVDRVSVGIENLSRPGAVLASSMADVSAMTGITGGQLKEIEGYARANAKVFGGDAAKSAESYKLILSQLNPEIAKVPEALKSMGEHISITSKLMGGDIVAASGVLTTAMNQFQVSTDDPIAASREMGSMMNIMAAAAAEGSSELPQIKAALEQSGMAAKTANVSFAEANAAIQVLDKAGKRGAEGGVALRNALAILGQGRFLPEQVQQELASAGVNLDILGDKSLSLADRLKPLQKIAGDSALMTKLFGRENMNAAIAMVAGIDEIERYTQVIQGTNAAVEQAATIMESPAEKASRLQARIDDLKVSVFNATGGWLSYAATIGSATRDLSGLAPVIMAMGKGVMWLANTQNIAGAATKVWTAVQWALNAAFWANPITWVVAGIAALVAGIVWVVKKTEGWGEAWEHTVTGAKLLWEAFTNHLRWVWNSSVAGILNGLDNVKLGWYKFKAAVGIGDNAENAAIISKISSDIEARQKAIVEGAKRTSDLYKAAANEFVDAAGSVHLKAAVEENGAQAGASAAGAFQDSFSQNSTASASITHNGAQSGTNAAGAFQDNFSRNSIVYASVHHNGTEAGSNAAGNYLWGFNAAYDPGVVTTTLKKGLNDNVTQSYSDAGARNAQAYLTAFNSINITGAINNQLAAINSGVGNLQKVFKFQTGTTEYQYKDWRISSYDLLPKGVSKQISNNYITQKPKSAAPAAAGDTPRSKGGGGQSAGRKANEAIATGGTKNTTINITIGKQESNVTVQNHTGKLAENKQQMQDMMLDMMIRSIASAQSLA
ncbi:MAG: phage tail tape measure protein [Chitinophagaceae bacterium]|nr:phage tail tape measure protein [Chitinophagaceae bacterium]